MTMPIEVVEETNIISAINHHSFKRLNSGLG